MNTQLVQVKRRKPKKKKAVAKVLNMLSEMWKSIRRFPKSIMPARHRCELSYTDANSVRNNPGGNFLVYAMRLNDLFDPDPLILSGSVSNFKELMQFYAWYLVMYNIIEWTISNLENFPLCCGIVFSQSNLTGSIGTADDCENAFENDFKTEIKVVSAKGGMDRAQFTAGCALSLLLGNRAAYKSDLDWSGNGVATPNRVLWANFIVWSATGASLTNGWCNVTRMSFGSEFTGRVNNRT